MFNAVSMLLTARSHNPPHALVSAVILKTPSVSVEKHLPRSKPCASPHSPGFWGVEIWSDGRLSLGSVVCRQDAGRGLLSARKGVVSGSGTMALSCVGDGFDLVALGSAGRLFSGAAGWMSATDLPI